jgi:hypothetical protein
MQRVTEADMALTRRFVELVQKRGGEDPAFETARLPEGIDMMLAGDVATGCRAAPK